jgi:hypothetical protein
MRSGAIHSGMIAFDVTTNIPLTGQLTSMPPTGRRLASTDLVNPTRFPIQTNTLSGDSFYFSDPKWTNYPVRVYRIRSP